MLASCPSFPHFYLLDVRQLNEVTERIRVVVDHLGQVREVAWLEEDVSRSVEMDDWFEDRQGRRLKPDVSIQTPKEDFVVP